jgi:hypothetical protein
MQIFLGLALAVSRRCRPRPESAVPAVVTHVRWDAAPHVPVPCSFWPLVADTSLGRVYLKAGAVSVLRAPSEHSTLALEPTQVPADASALSMAAPAEKLCAPLHRLA